MLVVKDASSGTRSKQLASVVGSDDEDDLIPKPPGEVGRPNRGGYNLCDALGWPKDEYKVVQVRQSLLSSNTCLNLTVQKFINKAVENHLVCDSPMKQQSLLSLKKVRDMVSYRPCIR
ncbi:hypothetical protein F5878DRAFT_549272 [Lentinula raphanica]|uniref:Uncharacterized protein n=1 Tax=Lentinula raphanica TaxID=153919 RepID=A0AA38NW01_9AGAR|nr:hypothetical protein F5878DRAFT_549272 [Lentinula raphanica]